MVSAFEYPGLARPVKPCVAKELLGRHKCRTGGSDS